MRDIFTNRLADRTANPINGSGPVHVQGAVKSSAPATDSDPKKSR